VECERYGKKKCNIEENKEYRVISNRQRRCGYQKGKEKEAAWPREAKVQQRKKRKIGMSGECSKS